MQVLGNSGPEFFRVVNGLLVESLVLLQALNVSLGAELRRRRKNAVLTQRGVDVLAGKRRSGTCSDRSRTGNGGNGQGRHARSFWERRIKTSHGRPKGPLPRKPRLRDTLPTRAYKRQVRSYKTSRASALGSPMSMCWNWRSRASVQSLKFLRKLRCHPERTGPQTFFSLGVVSRRICGCTSANFRLNTLGAFFLRTASDARPTQCGQSRRAGCSGASSPGRG